ncbi:phage tail sheath subtilisin-like domain-containing protein [Streptosporangium sp. NBC_01755]|uniref:phage tail sheath family protein n=1 Tax=Streptosporangium sp. NBC_01755 TaxID=2975949 RepID=UPI002DDC2442|nr:phage tail sheath subtilisin-like domain-containing protein [Streptosporangium sp. NBC_01755]WSD01113.1 phage tail sheath subtilisin-like domain-containing protein [Streptosporangium sp. NBC_01755]
MISYQSPGVYIEEVPAGPQPISAAPTSVVAIVGTTEKGPYLEPARVTGWQEFKTLFGNPVEGGFTAEAVFGFFENGGPAAYVVRADPSIGARWDVLRGDATTVAFTVDASSPGDWANDLDIVVTPDTSAGSGQLYASRLALSGNQNIPAGATTSTLSVESTVGISAGDPVLLIGPVGAPRAGTVDAVQPGALTIGMPAGSALDLPAGASWVVAAPPNTAISLRFAAGTGFQRGDVLLAITPSMNRRSVVVDAAASATPGMSLTLAAALGGSGALPAGEFAPRVVRLVGELTAPTTPNPRNVPLSGLTWRDAPAPRIQDMAAGHEGVASNGLVAVWQNNRLEFPAAPPIGSIEVDARLVAHLFHEDVELVGPTRTDLAQRYSFLPNGTVLRLNRSIGAPLDLTRDTAAADGWAPAGTDPAGETWISADVRPPADARNGVVVRVARPPVVGDDFIELGAAGRHRITGVSRTGGNVHVVTIGGAAPVNASGEAGPYPLLAFQTTRLVPLRFALKVFEAGALVENYPQLALHPDHPRFYHRDALVNDLSARIRVDAPKAGAVSQTNLPALARSTRAGSDRVAGAGDLKDGLDALERVTEPAIVICPDVLTLADDLSQVDVIGAMVTHCERFRRFAVVDAPADRATDLDLARWRETSVASTQAGTYAPHVLMLNLDSAATRRVVTVPPSGFVAGVFARTDRERGVHKAPANERVRGIVGLAEDYTQRRQDLLNPAGVNLIRAFPGRGIRIWGARTSSADGQWRYVNVRRLFNLIETSVENSTQWVVFEPNTQSTWLRIRVSVENFLDQLWRGGALAGTTPEEAYRVRVGLGETMTETDVDLGLVITEVAVAPAKPAEFVVFRFSHKRLAE